VSKNQNIFFLNGGQDAGQDGGSKLELLITEPFMNRFG